MFSLMSDFSGYKFWRSAEFGNKTSTAYMLVQEGILQDEFGQTGEERKMKWILLKREQ